MSWKSKEYVTRDRAETTDSRWEDRIATFRFFVDSERRIHKRTTYSILDFLGDCGGVYESVFLLGSFVHMIFSIDTFPIKLLDNHFKVQNS